MAKIVPVKELEPAFSNAMRALISECGPDIMTMANTMAQWQKHYNSYILHDENFGWEVVAFKSEQDQVMFMLKWGS